MPGRALGCSAAAVKTWHILVGKPLRSAGASKEQITPVEGLSPRTGETVLSQIIGIAVGRHWAYRVVSLTVTLVLALEANTSFGGLPILASLSLAGPAHEPTAPSPTRN